VVFRADASTDVGMGHVMRCATLASELGARGAQVHFICRESRGHACDWLASHRFEVTRLPDTSEWSWQQDLAQVQAVLKDLPEPADWLVVDHYGLDARWESALRGHLTRVLMVIDDLDDRPHDCDLLLDQNHHRGDTTRYRAHTPPSTELLLGPLHALLAPAYREARAQRLPHSTPARRVLVCFGGADPTNHTFAALRALQPHVHALDQVDVVLGAANPHAAEVQAYCVRTPKHVLHQNVSNMAELLAQADLSIGAGGTMNWERCCLGVPSLVFGIADNQQTVLNALIADGIVLGSSQMPRPDPAAMAAWIQATLDNTPLLQGLAQRAASLVDGKGTQRVADRLLPSRALHFRPAGQQDERSIYDWRNDPSTRAVSRHSQAIPFETHRTWYAKRLADPACRLLIAELEGQAVGVARFDLRGPEAEISVYRVPRTQASQTGRPSARLGLIREASAWLKREHPEIGRIVAEVLPENAPSLAAFHEAGYRQERHTLVLEIHHEH
jgi:UDP-2,4-diacetamido-2,4,6-trideoxy-beta-L-altropyranose hydrolase